MILLPIKHGKDDKWGHNKHLHVCPQVPSLTNATRFLGQVSYVEDYMPPLFGTAIANELAVWSIPRFSDYILRDSYVEAYHQS